MVKLKSFFVLLLAAALVVLGAKLPQLVGAWQDTAADNQVAFGDVNEVHLQFAETDMTMRETLAISARQDESIEIPTELASRSQEEIRAIVENTIGQYQERSLINHGVDMDALLAEYRTVLSQSGQKDGRSNIFWSVVLRDDAGEWSLWLTIDDRTGKLCYVEYFHYSGGLFFVDKKTALYQFCDLFLSGLGDEFSGYEPDALIKTAELSGDESYMTAQIVWEDEIYGEIILMFIVSDNNFHTYIY